jgi:alpha-L-fucosidase
MRSRIAKSPVVVALVLAGANLFGAATQPSTASWPKADPAAIARFQAMRFGMFIHWGPVSLTGREIGWSRGQETPIEEYDSLYKRFDAPRFNASEWVRVAKAAGMKYVILTTKHHDGFCLWDTRQTDFNIMNSPLHRDVVKELAAACKAEGIAFGTYYSTCDWHHPDFPLTSPGGSVKREKSDLDAYNRYLQAQISELITNYGPLLTIWNDVPQMFEGRGANTIKLVRSLQPDILINDRSGDGGDYDTPEQRGGKFQNTRPWETCMTICEQWAWKPDDKMKSLAQCLHTLITCAGGDGNLLFNVGPTAEGVIEARQVNRLKEMGAWLSKNGESIYGTRGGPWKPTRSLATTRKGNAVFVHILRSEQGRVELPDLPVKIKSASLLAGGKVACVQEGGKLTLAVPPDALDPIDTIVKLGLDGSALDLPVLSVPSEVKASASEIYRNMTNDYGPQQAFDKDSGSRWATDSGTKAAWIAVDLGKAKAIGKVRIDEVYGRVTRFEFQCRDGAGWRTIFTGQQIGEHFERTFGPATAREFRLNILDATDGPTIAEIELTER